jgi:hypothetical protein
MYKYRFLALSLIALFAVSALINAPFAAAQNAPQANVDRGVVDEGDSLTLTITVEDSADSTPDYSVLKKDFDVSGNSQSTQHSLINGHISSHTEWQTTLIPKRSGSVTILPIAVGSAKTQAIVVQVKPAGKNSANDGSEPIFIEAQTDRSNVYVQQQILFTVRVFVAVQLENMQLTKPEFDNASAKQLSETTFQRDVNGTPYAVHELTYAIFPQQAGELTIPELVFSAVEATRMRSMFDFPGQGRTLRRMSKQLDVHVKPIPKSFGGNVWLPARNLTLVESWGGDVHRLTTGESITRNISIRADGLLAAQLPALEPVALDNAKIYADQPTLDDQQDATGVHGKRVENMAVIPTRAGPLRLPETKIVWWDVDSDSEKIATLNDETLNVLLGSGAATQPSTQSPVPAITAPANPPPVSNTDIKAPAIAQSTDILTWQIACAGLLLLWLITVMLYWRARRLTPNLASVHKDTESTLDENTAWQALVAACRRNEPTAARRALLYWSRIYFDRPDLHSIDQLQRMSDDALLTRELQQLDNRLFGALRDSGDWNGETFLQVLKKLKSRGAAKTNTAAQLPPLYPVG